MNETTRAKEAGKEFLTRKWEQQELKDKNRKVALASYNNGITPLEFMLEVMRDPDNDIILRMDAAKSAAPYVHPKLASVEMKHTGTVTTVNLSDEDLLEMLAGDALLIEGKRIDQAIELDTKEDETDFRSLDGDGL